MPFFYRNKHFFYPLTIWFLIVCWYFIFISPYLNTIKLKAQDFIFSQSFYLFYNSPPEFRDIVIVAIDEASRRDIGGRWDREVNAELLKKIIPASPKVIGLDIVFSGKSEKEKDSALKQAFESFPNIILAYALRGNNTVLPEEEFIDSVKAVGFANKVAGRDSVVRKTRLFQKGSYGRYKFSFDAYVLAAYLGVEAEDIRVEGKNLVIGNKLSVSSEQGIIPINYLVYPDDFTSVSAISVLKGEVSPVLFRNKIVLIGDTDPLAHDVHLTPLGLAPGVTVVGNSLTMLLAKKFVHSLSGPRNFLLVLLLGLVLIIFCRLLRPAVSFIVTCVYFSGIFAGFVYLRTKGLEFDYLSILLLAALAYVCFNAYKYSYLIYMSSKLKKLAITDSWTGFYSLRYFMLTLDSGLKQKPQGLAVIGFLVTNQNGLLSALSFEEYKSLVKSLAGVIKLEITRLYKEAEFSRISTDLLGSFVWTENKDACGESIRGILDKINDREFRVSGKKVKLSLKGIVVYRDKGRKVYAGQIFSAIETAVGKIDSFPDKPVIFQDIEEGVVEIDKDKILSEGMDFLESDLTARNRDMEQSLEDVIQSKQEIEKAYLESITSLVRALEEKDTFTQGHSERVAEYSLRIAKETGLSEKECDNVYRAALLHDIGKIGIPDYVLHKKEKLSEEEINLIRKHEITSVQILKPIKAFEELLPIVLSHHEWLDGTGYPYGLSGDMIPKGAQILAVADSFDAITSGRGYKKGKSFKEAIEELKKFSGARYNPEYIKALEKVMGIE